MMHNRRYLLLMACALLPSTAHASKSESQSLAPKDSNALRSVQPSHHLWNDQKRSKSYAKTSTKPHGQRVTSAQDELTQRANPAHPANGQPPAALRNSADPSQPAQTLGAGGAKHTTVHRPMSNALPIRPPDVGSPGSMSQNSVRHQSPDPGALGGSAGSNSTSTASINGTAVHHRP
jgi:hypothetical protein